MGSVESAKLLYYISSGKRGIPSSEMMETERERQRNGIWGVGG